MKPNFSFDYIIYGGAFDPPHLGHLYTLKTLAKVFPLREIIIMPYNNSPSKIEIKTNIEHRIKMCRLLSAEVKNLRSTISDLEKKLPSPNYTINSLEALAKIKPNQNPALLLGDDNLKNFSSWKEYKNILKKTVLIIMPRLFNLQTNKGFCQELIKPNVKLEWQDSENVYFGCVNDAIKFIILDANTFLASSSEIKSAQKKIDQSLLTSSVYNYICENNLYQTIGDNYEHS